ncbi:hypothetical protein A4A49_51501, partial [Nicotiana attenuata]
LEFQLLILSLILFFPVSSNWGILLLWPWKSLPAQNGQTEVDRGFPKIYHANCCVMAHSFCRFDD